MTMLVLDKSTFAQLNKVAPELSLTPLAKFNVELSKVIIEFSAIENEFVYMLSFEPLVRFTSPLREREVRYSPPPMLPKYTLPDFNTFISPTFTANVPLFWRRRIFTSLPSEEDASSVIPSVIVKTAFPSAL